MDTTDFRTDLVPSSQFVARSLNTGAKPSILSVASFRIRSDETPTEESAVRIPSNSPHTTHDLKQMGDPRSWRAIIVDVINRFVDFGLGNTTIFPRSAGDDSFGETIATSQSTFTAVRRSVTAGDFKSTQESRVMSASVFC